MNIYLIPVLTIIAAWMAVSLPLYWMCRPRQLRSLWNTLSMELSRFILAELNTVKNSDKLLNPEVLSDLTPTIEIHIDQFLRVKLLEKMPFLSTFLGESTLTKLKTGMMEEIELLLPDVVEKYISKTASTVNWADIINSKLNAVRIEELEKATTQALKGKVTKIKWMAVLIGLIVGLIQIAIISL